MAWFRNINVGRKLVLGFSGMMIFLAAIGLTGYFAINDIYGHLEIIFHRQLPAINYLIQADRDFQQLLVAERSMIFTNAKSDEFKSLVATYEENLEQARTRFNKYRELASTPAEKELIAQFQAAVAKWSAVSRRVVDGRAEDTRAGRRLALDLSLGEAREKFETMRDPIDKLTELNLAMAEKEEKDALAAHSRSLALLLGIAIAGFAAAILMTWFLTGGITRPLLRVIDGLSNTSSLVVSASGQIGFASQSLAEGASEQAASLEETSSSLEEMSAMTRQNADNAKKADELVVRAKQVMERANGSMAELIQSMHEISSTSDETSKIIKTIDEIAFQTNLLALNAAVEAARAGEAGAGFAVVADEVRNLAMRAAEAAKNTAELIESSVRTIGEGSRLVETTNEAFAEVAQNAAEVAELVGMIASASSEQAEGIQQVSKAVAEIDKVTQRNAASAEESASASNDMTSRAEDMNQYIADLTSVVGGSAGRPASDGRSKKHSGRSAVPMETGPDTLLPEHYSGDDW